MSSSMQDDVTNRSDDPIVYDERSPEVQEPSLSELLSALSDDVTTLFRQEVELAKVEVKQEAVEAGKAAGMLVAGAIAAFVTLLLLAWAASWALALAMPVWAGFLIVAVIFGTATAGLVFTGRKKLQDLDPTPHETIETLQEDKQMLTDRNHR
jgi:uncharacterized membrane protein YqjE